MWGFYYGSCGFMVVKVGGCRGDGGGRVAVRFLGCCEVSGRELKMKKMREMREKKDIVLIYIILFCKYIILMSRRGK